MSEVKMASVKSRVLYLSLIMGIDKSVCSY